MSNENSLVSTVLEEGGPLEHGIHQTGKPPQTTVPQHHGNQQHGRTDALAILGWAAGQKLEGEIGD